MKKKLIIVESPTKAKTIGRFLGKDYIVLSSFGHVRDLPKNALGVDVDHDFAPSYVVPTKARKVVSELKKAAKDAEEVFFATDEDREGEAISWHLAALLHLPEAKLKRIAFHEITEEAVRHALENPRHLDEKLVHAQQARRVLDRLVGYELSPFLWKKVARGLSAGRVQSVAVRLIVDREREITAFVPREYWSVEAMLAKQAQKETFLAKLTKKDGETLDKFALSEAGTAQAVAADLTQAEWKVVSVEKKTVRRSPPVPFTTSTLQQEANNKLGYGAKQTMVLAQQLYEGVELGEHGPTGLITYMRTDSVNLAKKFIEEARTYLKKTIGEDAVPEEPRRYKTKAKLAQEAHEAIRPTSAWRKPEDVASHLDDRQRKLYELIWRRAMASQMVDAELSTVTVDADASSAGKPTYSFRATGSTVKKASWMAVYETESKETLLPELEKGDALDCREITPKQHFTEPPPRYTEATLVKSLEEAGIGRPSTYAPTIGTVVDRGYVEKEDRKLKPTELAFLVNDLLVANFPDIVDYRFTAHMEESLDDVAEGKKEWVPLIREFFVPFEKTLRKKEKEIDKKDIVEEKTDVVCDKCGKPMVIKFGRFGKFLACTGFPECRNTKAIVAKGEKTDEEKAAGEKCPTCGSPMMVKRGRFGEFLSCTRYPDCKTLKPLLKKTGVICDACGNGDIVEKRTKRGKTFYACSRYPDCKNALWSKPTGEKCPKSGHLLVFARGDMVRCSSKECDFEKAAEKAG